jgi:hypothetical protein
MSLRKLLSSEKWGVGSEWALLMAGARKVKTCLYPMHRDSALSQLQRSWGTFCHSFRTLTVENRLEPSCQSTWKRSDLLKQECNRVASSKARHPDTLNFRGTMSNFLVYVPCKFKWIWASSMFDKSSRPECHIWEGHFVSPLTGQRDEDGIVLGWVGGWIGDNTCIFTPEIKVMTINTTHWEFALCHWA